MDTIISCNVPMSGVKIPPSVMELRGGCVKNSIDIAEKFYFEVIGNTFDNPELLKESK